MFRNACTIARQFTRPVILCRQAASLECSSGIGSFVVVNDEGWIVTAGHIIEQLEKLVDEEQDTQSKIGAGEAVPDEATLRASAHWGWPECTLTQIYRHPLIDLAVGKLEPFDQSWITTYPVIKDPTKDFDPGASLCKEGYPFHAVKPTWDDDAKRFEVGAQPLPFFPIEGIFTRVVEFAAPAVPAAYPLMYLETSSPGLRGQSGGPTFDVLGAIWGIQSQTRHYALGFNPPIPGGKNGETEHQFLNVGWGVHAATLIGVFGELGIKHTVSPF